MNSDTQYWLGRKSHGKVELPIEVPSGDKEDLMALVAVGEAGTLWPSAADLFDYKVTSDPPTDAEADIERLREELEEADALYRRERRMESERWGSESPSASPTPPPRQYFLRVGGRNYPVRSGDL